MATESSRSSSSSSSSSSPALVNDAGGSYIGSFISLISKYEIRYEGVLYQLNLRDSTLGLKNVRSYGTEGRKKDGQQIPPSDKVYEYILFRGSDIKDLQVKSPPSVQSKQEIQSDPAIIQSRYSGEAMSSSLSGSGSGYSFVGQWMGTPAMSSNPFPAKQHSQDAQSTGGSSIPMSSIVQGNKDATTGVSLALNNAVPSPSAMHNQPQPIDLKSSPIMGVVNDKPNSVTRVSAHGSSPLYSNLSPLPQSQLSTPDSLSSFPAPIQNSYPTDPQLVHRVFYETASSRPNQSIPYELPVVTLDQGPINPGPLLTLPQPFLGTDQLLQSRSQALPLMQTENGGRDVMAALKPISLDVLLRRSVPVNQAPLLPLPDSAQQYPSSSLQFSEEFDFEAMNQKFNKDEVWGYLGKNKQRVKTDIRGEIVIEPSSEGNAERAYKKDGFFDTISCNSLNRGARSGQTYFSDRMKQDTETFGNSQRRPQLQPGYGEYVAGRANYRGGYNLGTGYSYYGGRGRGRNTHF